MSHPLETSPHPGWRPPIDDADVYGIVRMRQQAFRESSAFPARTVLSDDERQAIIEAIPPLEESLDKAGAVNLAAARLKFFATSGELNSLDLARSEVMASDWSVSRKLDEELLAYLRTLEGDDGLRQKMGIATLRVIDKSSVESNPESSVTRLSDRLAEQGLFLVTRRRQIARFALRHAGQEAVIRKVSDFVLDTAHDDFYNDEDDELFRMSAMALARGGFDPGFADAHDLEPVTMNQFNARLIERVKEGVEKGIANRAGYLRPISVLQHVAMVKSKRKIVRPAPLQRPASAS